MSKKENKSVLDLRQLLVGKRVISVAQGELCESFFRIETEDGASFHICGDTGSWIVPGPSAGYYTSVEALSEAVEGLYRRTGFDVPFEEVLDVTQQGDTLVASLTGSTEVFKIKPSSVEDPWEAKVLGHTNAVEYLKEAIPCGPFWKMTYQPDKGDKPTELQLPNKRPNPFMPSD